MTAQRVIIEPRGPFFLGLQSHARKSGALLHSDTLHAALLDTAALVGSPLLDAPRGIRVSSLFPCWSGVYFYPKPFLPPPGSDHAPGAPPQSRKRWKSIRLVSDGLLRAWLTGDVNAPGKTIEAGEGAALLVSERKASELPLNGFIRRDLAPAVTVDRAGGGTMPYDRRGIRLNTAEGVRAWFAVEIDDGLLPEFQRVLEALEARGLGGERSVGYGQFRLERTEPWASPLPESRSAPPDAFLSLSLYLPTKDEVSCGVLREPAAYDCALREGWLHDLGGSTGIKKSVRMCVEGSVFPVVAGRHGDVVDVRPPGFEAHPVWRSGLAFEIPFFSGARRPRGVEENVS